MEHIGSMPRQLSKKILAKLNEGRAFVVTPGKNPRRARVFDLEKYDAKRVFMREMVKHSKPWTRRWGTKQKTKLGPLGSKPLGTHSNLSRTEIYEGI